MSFQPITFFPGLFTAPILALTPFERADLRLAQALLRQQVPAVVDLGRDPGQWPALFASLAHEETPGLGLRLPDGVSVASLPFPSGVTFLVVAEGVELPAHWRHVPRLYQVCSLAAATAALQQGAAGLIAKGQECGGLVGAESSFVLLQRLVDLAAATGTPVWCQGGVSLQTAAAAFAGGATGVVIDAVLAGLPESALPETLKQRVLAMDGSEVRCLAGGYQVLLTDQRELSRLDQLDAEAVRARLGRSDDQQLWAVGQDAALARGVHKHCSSVEALIKTLRMHIEGQLRQARDLQVMAEGSPWAAAHGTRYPIAQGPMTRVSDVAEFSAAVADAGALPFTALSLMNADDSRRLLTSTRDQLAGRPWGVGVLGFADAAILDPQLELVREFKPDVLLLAGGRPSQARPFIEMGIATYLHVPSPGLLELFLKEGATHFVFEGRECGGHVGPRYSFVLWQQAIACLLEQEHPERLHVLFAGGIHDARSSAMVAAIAAPLAARGAKVGVLLGTAYLATREAVATGAVLAEFQRRALGGGETVLVETAPGHAIRCVPSGFMTLFEREKARLQGEGVEPKQIWQQLEALTVGRLRIASKGIDRVDGHLVPVPQAVQESEGMYMIGQVVALQRQVTTMAALHAAVAAGATAHLQALPMPSLARVQPRDEPVAIVGMACLYAGSPDLESYWENILSGRDLVGEVPAERWSVEQYYRGAGAPPDKSVSQWGGFIADTPFDPLQYGIPPASLAAIEPVQLLSLEIARQALRDAGYGERWFDREKTSVIFGAEAGMDLGNQYTFRNLWQQYGGDLPPALAEALPALTEDSFPGMLVNVISGRIANRLGLGGVNYAVTSACASSLTAIELAVKELRSGTSDMALAGGADFHNGISDYLMFSSVGALSAKGRCRSFDNAADGIALGEGVGVVVLKRLADARRDGDRIYAVIDGIAGSSDGKGLGLTAPRKEGQKRSLERAYWQAGVLPADIGLVEAHGTGTVVGDRTELQTLSEVYGSGGAVPGQAVLGSVKSQIGHTKCAAGVAGLIKIAKALHHGVQPGTQQISSPNAWYRPETSPFRFNARPQPWLTSGTAPARAAVSAFGFGGANFHAVLSAWPRHRSRFGAVAFPAELFAVRAATRAEALTCLQRVADYLRAATAAVALRDLARTVWEAGSGPVQLAWVASDRHDLETQLAALLENRQTPAAVWRDADLAAGKVACLFSGQGSQYPGMLRDLFVYFPSLQQILAEGRAQLPVIYPATAYDEAGRARQQQALTDTRQAQPALGLVEWAAFQWLRSFGLQPDMAAGHSYGELVALATAGAFDLGALLRLSHARAEAMLSVVGDDAGSMAAVSLDVAALTPLLAGFPDVVMANQNSPVQTVISGPTAAVQAALAHLKAVGVAGKAIATACAFHSPLMAPASQRFAQVLADQSMAGLQWPVYGNQQADRYADEPAMIRDALASHVASPVRFVDEIERMHDDGARIFIEVGPRKVLTGLVTRILQQRSHVAFALDQGDGSLASLLATLARLAVLIPDFDASALFDGRAGVLDLEQPPKLSVSTWMVNGGRAWPRQGKLPAHAAAVVMAPVLTQPAVAAVALPVAAAPVAAGEQAIVGYLNNMRDLVNAQRDVLLSFLGTPAAVTAPRALPPAEVVRVAAAHQPQVAPAVAVAPALPVESDQDILLTLVSERTGYPVEMLDLDLDLEADLSIDSIKRLEVIGELSQRLQLRSRLGHQADNQLEQLAAQKTLRAVLAWLQQMPLASPAPTPVAQTVSPYLSAPAAAPALALNAVLLGIVSDCTGYPVEALDLDLDLEADLSIDSIKRLEIVGQLSDRIGLDSRGGERDALLDSLAACKTLRAMLTWLKPEAVQNGAADVATSTGSAEPESEPEPGIAFARYVLRSREVAPAPARHQLAGLRLLLTSDDLGIAPVLAARLQALGARVDMLDFTAGAELASDLTACDGLIHLASVNPGSALSDVKRFFTIARQAVLHQARHLLVLSAQGGDFARLGADPQLGGGFAGMIKTLAREFPELQAHWLDVDLGEPAETLAGYVVAELCATDDVPEVAWLQGRRQRREVLPAALEAPALAALPLTRDSVVLLTGGARGITARVAIELAQRYQCHLELVGRSPAPAGEESGSTVAITDPRQLRQALLVEDASRKPAEVERLARRLLAEREFRATRAAVHAAGASVHYTALDVRDGAAFTGLIADIYARRGHIDGVIHGAGVVEDKLVRDKSDDSFARVFDTKVNGALVLRQQIRDDVAFVVFFSSVASAFGNRGQVDYATANDVLDKLAHSWQGSIKGRVLSVNWGPWADTGMVSDALRNEYARKGIGLIPQAAGVAALFAELAGASGESQVVLMSGRPESFAARSNAVEG